MHAYLTRTILRRKYSFGEAGSEPERRGSPPWPHGAALERRTRLPGVRGHAHRQRGQYVCFRQEFALNIQRVV